MKTKKAVAAAQGAGATSPNRDRTINGIINPLKIKTMKTITKTIGMALTVLMLSTGAFSQTTSAYTQAKATVGILHIDTKGVLHDPAAMSNLVRLELEKANVYTVLDKYDQADVIEQNNMNITNCYGKTCVVNAGKLFKVDKMLTGSVERSGEKIVITLRLIDVKTATVEKTNATEYLNLQPEVQKLPLNYLLSD